MFQISLRFRLALWEPLSFRLSYLSYYLVLNSDPGPARRLSFTKASVEWRRGRVLCAPAKWKRRVGIVQLSCLSVASCMSCTTTFPAGRLPQYDRKPQHPILHCAANFITSTGMSDSAFPMAKKPRRIF
jgi:hypothetical protein